MKVIICLALVFAGPTVSECREPFPDDTDDKFQDECLTTSNNYRAKHHAPALKMDQEAVTYAQSRCKLISQKKELDHGHEGLSDDYGENLYWGGSSSEELNSCKAAIDGWYNEVMKYDFNKPGFTPGTGHFTALVWKGSTAVGCARCGGKGDEWYETYVVCNYKPPGNVVGQFPENVQKP